MHDVVITCIAERYVDSEVRTHDTADRRLRISQSYMGNNNEIPADEILSRYGDTINFHLDNIIDPPKDDGKMISNKTSPYYGINCLPRSLDQIPGQLNILSINAQSLNAKYDELLLLLNIAQSQNIRFYVICIQETWLSETSDYSLVAIDSYN